MNTKKLTEFLQDVNKGIFASMLMKAPNPLHPNKEVLCEMQGLSVEFAVRVNANGEVTHGQDVAAKLHFRFSYAPSLLDDAVKDNSSEDEDTASAPLSELEVEFVPSPETEEKFATFKHDLKILGDAIDQLPELEAKRLKPLQSRFLDLIVELAHNLLMVKGYGYVKATGTRKQ